MTNEKRNWTRAATAIGTAAALALVFAVAGSALAQGAPAAAADAAVPIKGVVDYEDGVAAAPKPETPEAAATRKRYSPYAGRTYPTRVYFGDTHHHTANSGDAFMAGDRLTPEQAYRFARGEEVVSSTGVPARLSRPLDFLVVSDHAEGLGVMLQVYEGNPAFAADPTLARWGKAMKAGGQEAAETMRELVSAQAQNTLPPVIKDPKVMVPIMKSVWQAYTATADKFNDPGRFIELVDFAGKPLSKDYAERRARWEVLQEVMQTKGNSETHPLISPNDEFADFGIAGWEYGNLTLEGKPLSKEMMPTNYLRAGLLQGLMQEQKLGANPFKFGFIGGTDVHNSLTAIEEDNFFGKHVDQEPSPTRWEHVAKKGFGKTRYNWIYTAAGYAAVWATDNTREALWDAMKRKEVYATSGSRMTVRFFAGWDFKAGDARSRYLADAGYAKGVPMGADLPKAPSGAAAGRIAPTFLVAAMKDAQSGTSTASRSSRAGWTRRGSRTRRSTMSPGATPTAASPARTASCRRSATR